jgi:hypothetical protein
MAGIHASSRVVLREKPRMDISSFAVILPPSALQDLDEPPVASVDLGNQGIVGTIAVMKSSIMIWFGWGQLEMRENTEEDEAPSQTRSIGTGTFRPVLSPA